MSVMAAQADEIFYHSPEDGNGGLRIALKGDDGKWNPLGPGFDLVKSDFGAWGSHKKMWNPQLFRTPAGWACLFRATPQGDVIGLAESPDLINWKPQRYLAPSDTAALPYRKSSASLPATAEIEGKTVAGYVTRLDNATISALQAHRDESYRRHALNTERCEQDPERFAGIDRLAGKFTATGTSKAISPLLMGIFFEDINYAADGGLYGELIQNRDFEYTQGEGLDKNWGPGYAWSVTGDKIKFDIKDDSPLHPANPHYARVEMNGGLVTALNDGRNAFVNSGYDGITLAKGEPYRLRFKARAPKTMNLEIELTDAQGRKMAAGKIKVKASRDWNGYELLLTPDEHTSTGRLAIIPKNNGTVDLDMVSLFPVNTYKGRENGMRRDLAETLAALKPRFVRFPGGCVAHGNGLDNVYDWKGSIGPLEARKPLRNLWGYHQTRGLGYHEYFQFCEDIGAKPLPVLHAGVPCQNSSGPSRFSHDAITANGQQGGLPMDSLDAYIQDILDLVEYANGPATSFWGAKRAEAGHPEPFGLEYLGIGNEDMITDVFEERFTRINRAVKNAHPEIKVVGTVGPFYAGADYDAGWDLARREKVDMVDEHYYVDPGWLIYNQDFYDGYDRTGTKVYLGEWAAHLPGRPSNMETALAEALYLTAVERNGDVVELSSYAPLLAKENHTQWRPDLIYFNNTEVKPTTDYHTMRLFGENAGDTYLNADLDMATDNPKAKARVGASAVRDSETGDVIVKFVNLTPVPADMEVDLTKVFESGQGAVNSVTTVMAGRPADDKGSIRTERVQVPSPHFNITIQPYSLTVMRMPTNM